MFVANKYVHRWFLLLFSAAASLTAIAAPSSQVSLDSAIVSGDTLVITGQNFGTATPTVQLGQTSLTLAQPATATMLVVNLPAALPPGSYPLFVSFGSGTSQQGTLDGR